MRSTMSIDIETVLFPLRVTGFDINNQVIICADFDEFHSVVSELKDGFVVHDSNNVDIFDHENYDWAQYISETKTPSLKAVLDVVGEDMKQMATPRPMSEERFAGMSSIHFIHRTSDGTNLQLDETTRHHYMLDDEGYENHFTPSSWLCIAMSRKPTLPKTSTWFSGDVAPLHIGWYERYFVNSAENLSEKRIHYWDGEHWRRTPIARIHHLQVGDYPAWRGLAAPSELEDMSGLCWNGSGVWFEEEMTK